MNILVTGGCSFSEPNGAFKGTWPIHLYQALLGYQHVATGMGSQGNGLISRRIIHEVSRALKTTPAENILVGIMWSGPDRYDFFKEDFKFDHNLGWMENPTSFVNKLKKNWVILNHGWKNDISDQYYKNFHSFIGHTIYTCEHILRVQWFLKLHNIRYFMSAYTSEVMHNEYILHPEVKFLYDQIDQTQFLPVTGEYEWCRDFSSIPFDDPKDFHPNKEQHQEFTNQVIIPFLKNKNYI